VVAMLESACDDHPVELAGVRRKLKWAW